MMPTINRSPSPTSSNGDEPSTGSASSDNTKNKRTASSAATHSDDDQDGSDDPPAPKRARVASSDHESGSGSGNSGDEQEGNQQSYDDRLIELDAAAVEFDTSGRSVAPSTFQHVVESAEFLLSEEDPPGAEDADQIHVRRLEAFSVFLADDVRQQVLLDDAFLKGKSLTLLASGFAEPLFANDDGTTEYESPENESIFDRPVLLTVTVKDIDLQYIDGEPVVWVETVHAWYRLDTPRSDYAGQYHEWLLPHFLAARVADAIAQDVQGSVEPADRTTLAQLVGALSLPPTLAPDQDALATIKQMAFHRTNGHLDTICQHLEDFHDPTSFDNSHPLVAELGIQTKRARAKGKSRALPSNVAANRVALQRPSVITPLVDGIRRSCSVFSKKVVAHGNADDFAYPPAVPIPTNEISVGAVVVVTSDASTPDRPPTNWLVRAIDQSKTSAHLLKVVAGTETMVGTFADAEQHFAVPECRQTNLERLKLARGASAPTVAVQSLFNGTAYIALHNVAACPGGCGADAASDPPAEAKIEHGDGAGANAIIQDWALSQGLYPSIDCEARSTVWVNGEWVFAYDYVNFAVDANGNAVLPDLQVGGASFRRLQAGRNRWAPQSSLYAIAQVIAIAEAESDDADDGEEAELRPCTFATASRVEMLVELLGRWDSLDHSLHPDVGSHPRRLFLTKHRMWIPAVAVAGTLCVVPLHHAGDKYFDFPRNFVTIGEHPDHDAIAALRIPSSAATKRRFNPSTDPDGLLSFNESIANVSVSVLLHLDRQLKSLSFKRGQPVVSPTAADVDEPIMLSPMRALDLFAGCGGLTVGFDQDALAACKTEWAVEQNAGAARTFQANFPDAEVLAVDANEVLRRAIDANARGDSTSAAGVPAVGQVDMIYCGPPCQAVSRLNMMPQADDSKNTLFAVSMSFVELYRPKVFFLENVTGILEFQLGGIQTGPHVVEGGHPGGLFRFMIRVLLSLGYQVTWTVAQVGGFGCPQSRRRVLLLATLPHVKLPTWPAQTHLFPVHSTPIPIRDPHVLLSEPLSLWNATRWYCSATSGLIPPATVNDITSDLPPFDWKSPNNVMRLSADELVRLCTPALPGNPPVPQVNAVHPSARKTSACGLRSPCYGSEPRSELQRRLRRSPVPADPDLLSNSHLDHWRGIENFHLAPDDDLADYHQDAPWARQVVPNYVNRSYTADTVERICHVSRTVKPYDHNTLPRALKPAGQRKPWHNGAYGRLRADGQMQTVVTDPHPSRKMGTILHPVQNRILTVREMARAQSFPDSFVFTGDVSDMYQQVGNAVPPFLSAAVNRALFDALLGSPLHGLAESEARAKMGLPGLSGRGSGGGEDAS